MGRNPYNSLYPASKPKVKRLRKPMVSINFTERPWTDGDKALVAGMVTGTLYRLGRNKQAHDFINSLSLNQGGISPLTTKNLISEANKYVYFKII